jgi:hypothetical protein
LFTKKKRNSLDIEYFLIVSEYLDARISDVAETYRVDCEAVCNVVIEALQSAPTDPEGSRREFGF